MTGCGMPIARPWHFPTGWICQRLHPALGPAIPAPGNLVSAPVPWAPLPGKAMTSSAAASMWQTPPARNAGSAAVWRAGPARSAAAWPIRPRKWPSTWPLSCWPGDLLGNRPMSDSAERVLLIAHSDWREGRLPPLVEAKGYRVEWCCPAQGATLPPDDERYAGAIVLGGAQSANDAESQPYLRQEIDWIARWIGAG